MEPGCSAEELNTERASLEASLPIPAPHQPYLAQPPQGQDGSWKHDQDRTGCWVQGSTQRAWSEDVLYFIGRASCVVVKTMGPGRCGSIAWSVFP